MRRFGTPVLTSLVVFVYALPGLLERWGERRLLPWILGEDGIYESLGAVFALVAGIIFLLLFVASLFGVIPKRSHPFHLLLGIALLFLSLEELNWGQRLFHFETPGWVYQANLGGEMAFHVIGSATVPMVVTGILSFGSVVYLSFLPWLCGRAPTFRRWVEAIGLPLAPRSISWATLVLFVLAFSGVAGSKSGHFQSEQFEMPLQALLLCLAIHQASIHLQDFSVPTRAGLAWGFAGLGVLLAVLLLNVATRDHHVVASYEFTWAMEKMGSGRASEAREHLSRVLALQPRHVGALSLRASIHLEEGELEKAERLIRKAAEIAPTNPTLYPFLISLMVEQRRWSDAIDAASMGVEANPWDFTLRLQLLDLLNQLDRRQEMSEHLEYLRNHLPADHPHREAIESVELGG